MATAHDARRVRTLSAREVEYDGHPRSEHDTGRIGIRKERQVLGEHVAGLEVGHDEDRALCPQPAT